MATGEALICKLKNIAPIEGADNIVQANLFGETIIISKDYKEGQLGLLCDCETVLSTDFCKENNLFRHSHLNKDTTKVGYFDNNPRVRPIRLRGVKCSGFWIPIESLSYISTKFPAEGIQIKEWQGHKICDKYVKQTRNNGGSNQKQTKKVQQVFHFIEHLDTDQLMRNLHQINVGDKIIVTTKVHGTSCRVGLLPCSPRSWYGRLWQKLFNTKNKYRMAVGSRHVLKHVEGQEVNKKASFYNDDIWTITAYEHFHGKLMPGETVYYEIVGYLPNGTPIMPTHDNKKLKSFLSKDEYKQFIEKYGESTTFHYGCPCGWEDADRLDPSIKIYKAHHKIFVYRITLTTEHGTAIDLSWEQLKRRCEEMAVNHVPEITTDWISGNKHLDIWKDENNWIKLTEQDCKFFPQHLNEGICVRVENTGLRPLVFKNKRFAFKVLEGIIKDTAVDLEEEN